MVHSIFFHFPDMTTIRFHTHIYTDQFPKKVLFSIQEVFIALNQVKTWYRNSWLNTTLSLPIIRVPEIESPGGHWRPIFLNWWLCFQLFNGDLTFFLIINLVKNLLYEWARVVLLSIRLYSFLSQIFLLGINHQNIAFC